jgi:hypothetical protein
MSMKRRGMNPPPAEYVVLFRHRGKTEGRGHGEAKEVDTNKMI